MPDVAQGTPRTIAGSSARVVEIFYNDRWGLVCSTSWGSSDAEVACMDTGLGVDGSSVTGQFG